jgi:hypothetical protein
MNSSVTMARVNQQVMPATLGPTVAREKTTVDVEVRIFSCYRHISDRNIYTTSLLLISSVLLSLFRQESLHYISTSYLIGFIVINPTGISTLYLYTSYLISFIVIIPTGISTLHLYFLSHRFYCHQSDRDLYTTSLLLISSVLLS